MTNYEAGNGRDSCAILCGGEASVVQGLMSAWFQARFSASLKIRVEMPAIPLEGDDMAGTLGGMNMTY